MNKDEALSVISDSLYSAYKELSDGLPGGSDEEWGYDEELVIEIAEACIKWKARKSDIEDPYVVWYFDNESWSKITTDMYQEDAYKEWWRLTSAGKERHDSSSETYFFLGSSNEVLSGRHGVEVEDDDFSIGYLLNKSFGE
jgi:hypothetical protein